jgi:hypothetical protein
VHTESGRKFEGKRPLGRRMHRWEGYIKMNYKEVRWKVIDWTDLAQIMSSGRLLCAQNPWVQYSTGQIFIH